MGMLTMGQALDAAVTRHATDYPKSEVCKAEVSWEMPDCWRVDLRADSRTLAYMVYPALVVCVGEPL